MLRGAALLERLLEVPPRDRDAWVDALLGIEPPPEDAALPRGSVPYLPCGVDAVLAVVRGVPLRAEDHFVDLGSGLGRVVMLAHLSTGARATGIEIQEHLVHASTKRAEALGLPVTFTLADAAETPLDGSVFFLYAPFNGPMLARVVDRLAEVAKRRAIVVCTVDLELRDVPWLARRETADLSVALYDSRA